MKKEQQFQNDKMQKEITDSIIDKMPVGIGIYEICREKVSLVYLNNAYYEMLGETRNNRKKFYGENAMDAIYSEDMEAVRNLINKLVSGADKGNVLHRVKNKYGELVWLNLVASVVERDGDYIKIYAAISDCDEIVKAKNEMELNRKKEQLLLSHIPGGVAIYRLKKNGVVTTDYISKGVAAMCGYSHKEFYDYIKDDAMINVRTEDIPLIMEEVMKSLNTHQPISIRYYIHSKNQTDILNRLDANIIDNPELGEDDVAIWYGVHTQVSEESRRTIIEQQHYRTILNMTDIAFFEWDMERGFYSSDKFSKYAISESGYDSIMGRRGAIDDIYPDDRYILQEYMKKIVDKDRDKSVIIRMKMSDGTYHWTEIIGYVEQDNNGKYIHIIGLLRDVDKEWVDQKSKLQEALEEARKANQAKSAFLSRMSHDMRTPLNGILGLASLMKDSIENSKLIDDLAQLEISGQYLLNLINDTLDVSRIETGNLELHPAVCDGKAIFESVIMLAKPVIDAKNIETEIKTSGLTYPLLYIDMGRVEQVMMNILGNAAKFTDAGGKIQCSMTNISIENGIIIDEVCIRDNGIGISKEFLPHLFEPFAQEDKSKKNSRQGTGLGMIITKQLVELMGGKISVESELGKGTCVTFTLVMPIATKEQINEWNLSRKVIEKKDILNRKRILLCEDHQLNAKIAIRILQNKGIIVEHAENGKKGLELFSESKPGYYDAVLMDVRMPVMDGLETTRAIRKLDREDAKRIPIIAMTANAFDEDVRQTREAGMDAHLSKPIVQTELFNELSERLK